MSAATRARAPSDAKWDGINWADIQRHVRGLQARIVKATQGGRHNKAKALQWLLTPYGQDIHRAVFTPLTPPLGRSTAEVRPASRDIGRVP
jgi:hypothetical protein